MGIINYKSKDDFRAIMPFILFNKPYNVQCQFSGPSSNLSDHIHTKDVYAAGRLDKRSEGLLILTDDGRLQSRITEPKMKLEKYYWVQLEGELSEEHTGILEKGVKLRDGNARALSANLIDEPKSLWRRSKPIRYRKHINTSWVNIVISEGRNHQIRRMTAHIGFPTLRLIRHRIGPWKLEKLAPGELITYRNKEAWSKLK
tara:strand:- start:905 stop:1507 length:603 start_codon:yes stop_codon:yes gene_type:complete